MFCLPSHQISFRHLVISQKEAFNKQHAALTWKWTIAQWVSKINFLLQKENVSSDCLYAARSGRRRLAPGRARLTGQVQISGWTSPRLSAEGEDKRSWRGSSSQIVRMGRKGWYSKIIVTKWEIIWNKTRKYTEILRLDIDHIFHVRARIRSYKSQRAKAGGRSFPHCHHLSPVSHVFSTPGRC